MRYKAQATPLLIENAHPLVTIAIPTFNRASFLPKALKSALAQDYTNLQIIVSDNASTDNTLAVLATFRDPRLQVLKQAQNLGMVPNWNACLNAAAGIFFLLLSDDDCLTPCGITALMGAAQRSNPAAACVFGGAAVVNTNGSILFHSPESPSELTAVEAIAQFFNGKIKIYPCSTLLSTSQLRDHGGYNGERFGQAADGAAWMMIALTAGKIAFVNDTVSAYCVHDKAMSYSISVTKSLDSVSAVASVVTHHQGITDIERQKLRLSAAHFQANLICSLSAANAKGTLLPSWVYAQSCWLFRRNLNKLHALVPITKHLTKLVMPTLYNFLRRKLLRGRG